MSVARIGTACLVVLALAFALAACGDDDDDSVSQEELAAAVDEAEQEATEKAETSAQIEELQAEIKSLQGEADGGGESEETTTTTAIVPDTGGVPGDAEPCGQGIYARSDTTSCPFALNVARAYYSSDVNTFEVYSPATGEAYTMSCSGSGPVTCAGGNNAAVYIP